MTELAAAPKAYAEAFEVRLPVFEGPLQLLLHLVESRRLDLLTVPLADVADAYVAHLARHRVDARHLAEFISIASRLILLKSLQLLPSEPAPLGAEEDPNEDQLRERLVEYRALRDAAHRLGTLDGATPAFRREPRESDLPVVVPPTLAAAVLPAALAAISPPPAAVNHAPQQVEPRTVTLGDQIAALRHALERTRTVVLQAVLAGCRSRTEAAVTVMALLELVRRREIRVEQRTLFGPIELESLRTGAR